MTKKEYQKYVDKKTPNSTLFKDICFAFLIGGVICLIAQCFMDMYKTLNLVQEDASSLTSVTMIFISIVLTEIGVYDKIAKFAGAGTLVPITGFANSIAAPAMEFKSEGLVVGLGAKMFVIAGPVLVYGIFSSVVLALYYYVINYLPFS